MLLVTTDLKARGSTGVQVREFPPQGEHLQGCNPSLFPTRLLGGVYEAKAAVVGGAPLAGAS